MEERSFIDKLMMVINKPKLQNKITLFKLLSITQKAGLGVRSSLVSIDKSEKHPVIKKMLQDVIIQVGKGIGLSDALSKHTYFFSTQEIELIRSSEEIGNMPEVLENIMHDLEANHATISKIKSAMTYPIMVLSFAAIAVVVLLIKVIPTMVAMFPSEDMLPSITLRVLAASDFVQSYWYLIIAYIVATIISYKLLYKFILPFRVLIDKIMISWGIVGKLNKTFNMYRFSKLFGDFYNAGISPTKALKQVASVLTNYHYNKKILDIKNDLEMGLSLTEAIEEDVLFDPILIQIIGIGESTGEIGPLLVVISKYYKDEVDNTIDIMTKMIEPLMMAFIAIVIGGLVASVFLPMGSLMDTIQ